MNGKYDVIDNQENQPTVSGHVKPIVSGELKDFKGRIPRLLELERKARVMVDSNYFRPAIMGFEAALRELD